MPGKKLVHLLLYHIYLSILEFRFYPLVSIILLLA